MTAEAGSCCSLKDKKLSNKGKIILYDRHIKTM